MVTKNDCVGIFKVSLCILNTCFGEEFGKQKVHSYLGRRGWIHNVVSISKWFLKRSIIEKMRCYFQFFNAQRCEGGILKHILKQRVSISDKEARIKKSHDVQWRQKLKSSLQYQSGSCQMSRNVLSNYLGWSFLNASNHMSYDWTRAEKPTFDSYLEQCYVVSEP